MDDEGCLDFEPMLLANLETLRALDLDALLPADGRADTEHLEQILLKHARNAEQAGRAEEAGALNLLGTLCDFRLSPEDSAELLATRLRMIDGRNPGPADFRGAQTDILADYIPAISHPMLQARVADTVYYNDRSKGAAAALAIGAYRTALRAYLDGIFSPHFDHTEAVPLEWVDLLHRLLQIGDMSLKRSALPDTAKPLMQELFDRAEAGSDLIPLARLAELALGYRLMDRVDIANRLEAAAQANSQSTEHAPLAVQQVFRTAADAHKLAGSNEAKRRCLGYAVDQTLRMRDRIPSALAQVYWTRRAIDELRRAGGFADRLKSLRQELLGLEERSLDEFRPHPVRLEIADIRQDVASAYESFDLPAALLHFAYAVTPVSVATLTDNAERARKTSIFGSLFGATHMDIDGKVIAQSEAPAASGEDTEWNIEQSQSYLDLWRAQVVNAILEPARTTIMRRFPLEERHFHPIVQLSPIVPVAHEHLFALGFARLFQGDFASAAHLLVPQLENSLRYALKLAARDSSTIKPDMIQEDRSLSALFESLRPDLDVMLGADLANNIALLFIERPGPTLRHAVAHGKLSTGACYHPAAIYGCWLIYHLVCSTVADDWHDVIAPAIAARR